LRSVGQKVRSRRMWCVAFICVLRYAAEKRRNIINVPHDAVTQRTAAPESEQRVHQGEFSGIQNE